MSESQSPTPFDSGSTLRDRIAKSLLAADRRFAQEDEMPLELYYAGLADAVIAVLLDMPLADWIALIASRPDVLKESRDD